jgi:predicted RNA polymerase sigma factor
VLKGSVLQFLGRRKQAADAYGRAVKLEPDHAMSAELRTIIEGLGS